MCLVSVFFIYYISWKTLITINLKLQKKAFVGIHSNAQHHVRRKEDKPLKWRLISPVILRVVYLCQIFLLLNPIICLSFVEIYRRGLRNILCPCCRKLNGNVTPKCPEINLTKMTSRHGEIYQRLFKIINDQTKH